MGSKCSPCDRAQQHPARGIAENNPACLGLEAGLLPSSQVCHVEQITNRGVVNGPFISIIWLICCLLSSGPLVIMNISYIRNTTMEIKQSSDCVSIKVFPILLKQHLCIQSPSWCHQTVAGLILGLCTANERRRYKVTPSLIRCAQT